MFACDDGKSVLQKADVIVLEPDFAEFIRSLERDVIAVHRARAQRREPHAEGVLAEFGAKLLLRQIPNFFCRKLHVYSVKGLFSKRFIHCPKKQIKTSIFLRVHRGKEQLSNKTRFFLL